MDFWDFGTPLIWVLYILTIPLSIWGVVKKLVTLLIISIVISGLVSLLAMMSIGSYLSILTGLQFIGLLWIILKRTSKN
ncbi:hypothetical protein SAMN05444487_11312 [Marininema mesophilum]|uniref:Uncharacterized protein n=1 Tax=Marininema mesophilum TaxID=1048340 RepID=A0A1H3AAU5_9BACL|nr:hypothetical protein [Marininema mesophilum]SDX26581.1 hypothetical protein SAMN05444487_11312 [Marininema mesophilum]